MQPKLSQQTRLLKFRKLTEVSRALTYAVSLDEVLNLTVEHAAELLEAKKAILMMMNDSGLLSVRAKVGIDADRCRRFAEPMDESLIMRLKGLLEADTAHFLGVPLVVGGNVTGILAVAGFAGATSGEEQEWLLSALADQAAVALEKTKLDEIIEFREKLIGMVSHDLRTPMTAILISCRSLLKRGDVGVQASAGIERIRACAERANRMIHDLLDYTQAHLGGGIRLQKRPADMIAIVRHAVDELTIAHPKRVVEVQSCSKAQGDWDADRLGQMVRNLLSNALHYSPCETPVRMVISTADNGATTLSMHNDGPPIPEARLPHIFEAMQRATAINDPSNRSVGLGLYIAQHIVEAHKGTIEVRSDAAHGTLFTVWLPG